MQDTEGFARHRLRSTPHGGQLCRGISGSFGLESVAALAWNRWQLWPGISGSFAMESVAAFVWNRWQLCRGIGGRIHLDSVAALAWNTQSRSQSRCPINREGSGKNAYVLFRVP